jgi:hypothetical protein
MKKKEIDKREKTKNHACVRCMQNACIISVRIIITCIGLMHAVEKWNLLLLCHMPACDNAGLLRDLKLFV